MNKVIITVHGIMDKESKYSLFWFNALGVEESSEVSLRQFYWDDMNGNIDKIAQLFTHQRLHSWVGKISDVVTYKFYQNRITSQLQSVIEMWLKKGYYVELLTHSLGTVVTYHTLCNMSPYQLKNVSITTMGSPMVSRGFRFFYGINKPVLEIDKWLNLSGSWDPVCMFGRRLGDFSYKFKKEIVVSCNHNAVRYINISRNHLKEHFGL